MSAIIDLFSRIVRPTLAAGPENSFPSAPIPQGHDRHIGKDEAGRPLILLGMRRLAGEPVPISYVLENLRVDHDLQCRIVDATGSARVDRFSVIRCLSTDEALQGFFLRTMDALLNALPTTPTLPELATAVETLIALFQAIGRPPTGPIVGLWGELLLIAEAPQPRIALAAWHTDQHETCDFSSGAERLEIKCSGDRTRRHHFSLEQCYAPSETTQLIASLFVEPASGGVSLGELWDRIRDIVSDDPEMALKLDRVCMETLGSAWQEARIRRYDQQRSLESLLLFDSSAIPRIDLPVPTGVSEVHFRSDLSVAIPVEIRDFLRGSGLFGAVLGRLGR